MIFNHEIAASPMTTTDHNLSSDVELVKKLPIVPLLLDVVCRTTGMGFVAVARVTQDRWIACSVLDKISFGLTPGGELDVESTLCHEIRQHREPVIIDHVEKDDRYCNHHTPAQYGFQSYISFPIFLKNGKFFGTLCAIDPKPARLNNPETIGMFKLFTDLISFHLQAEEKLATTESQLREELKNAELREQFIAILGHDLRNPATAVSNGAELLLRMPLDNKAASLAAMIKNSSRRMLGLIENILDFAKGHLGSGISLNCRHTNQLEKTLQHVIAEISSGQTSGLIKADFNLSREIFCDEHRIAQLFSNLMTNAFVHGSRNSPIIVRGATGESKFTLSVSNAGSKIPPAAIDHLFKPFTRGDFRPGQQGLGLGLYISSAIAHAHQGMLSVVSTDEATTFTFEMPLK